MFFQRLYRIYAARRRENTTAFKRDRNVLFIKFEYFYKKSVHGVYLFHFIFSLPMQYFISEI